MYGFVYYYELSKVPNFMLTFVKLFLAVFPPKTHIRLPTLFVCFYALISIYMLVICMFKYEDPISLRCASIRISQLHFNLINQCIDSAWARLLLFIQMPQHIAYIQMLHIYCTFVHTCMCHMCGQKKVYCGASVIKIFHEELTENIYYSLFI